MKAGIITFHNVNNYGSVLQTYATQETFRRLGCDTEIIDYCREDQVSYMAKLRDACSRSSFAGNPLLRLAYYAIKAPSYMRQKKVFQGFLDEYVTVGDRTYTSFEQLCENPPEIDIACTGSDQMWNSEYNKGVEKAFYLAFADDDVIKIAYSTSIGLTHFPENEVQETREYLEKYRAISVREASAVSTLEEIGISGAVHVLDPTLVLTGDEWREIASPKYSNSKPYVLIYQLNPNPEFDAFAEELAREKGCELLRINLLYDQAAKNGRGVNIPTVNEYISLFDNAEYVITDSFHGTAFCLNLNTPFFVFYPPKYSTRLESILELTGQQSRVVKNGEADSSEIDFAMVNRIFESERQKNIEFLKEALGI